jgi:predicted nucleic acid-binding protein
MGESVLVDNDIALKIACYTLCTEMLAVATINGYPPSLLGVARFVIRQRLNRAANIANKQAASAALEHLLRSVRAIEPNEAELMMAADLETEAAHRNLEFDTGESQLLAVLIHRGCDLLLTGDKRAIAAMAIVAPAEAYGRVACLEQLIGEIVRQIRAGAVRPHVCSEPAIDRAITLCFVCSRSTAPSEEEVLEGLASYIGHLAREAPGVMVDGYDLQAVIPNYCRTGTPL